MVEEFKGKVLLLDIVRQSKKTGSNTYSEKVFRIVKNLLILLTGLVFWTR